MNEMRILKTENCPSLSGLSTLTYNIGCKDDKEVYLCLADNTGQGIFNKGWVSLVQIESLLASKEPLTSGSLHGLFQGKSSNSAGFVLAVLLNEGLIKKSDDNLRHYERTGKAEFKKAVQVLVGSTPQKKTSKKRKEVAK